MTYMKKIDEGAIQKYKSGLTLQQIAQQYNCSTTAVRLFLLRNNVTLRKRSYNKIDMQKLNARLQQLASVRATTSVKSLAREFEVGEVTIRKYLRRADPDLVRIVVPRARVRSNLQ